MTECDEPGHDAQLHQLHHDVQHCLHIISMATEILKKVRNDERRFREVCDSLDEERRSAAKRMDAYLNAVCDGCDASGRSGETK